LLLLTSIRKIPVHQFAVCKSAEHPWPQNNYNKTDLCDLICTLFHQQILY